MKVLYDYQAFTMQRFGGVSKSFCELIKHMPHDVQYSIGIIRSSNEHLVNSEIMDGIQPVGTDYYSYSKKFPKLAKHKIYNILNRIGLIEGAEFVNKKISINKLVSGDFDVFHTTFYDDYFLPYLGDKPFVITVHDMMPELFPQFFPSPNKESVLKKKLCERAAAIIAVSENTKRDLVRLMDVPENKISVVYHGGPELRENNEPALIDKKYFLYIGQRDAYKNFERTLRDFFEFSSNNPDVYLVCTGKPFSDSEQSTIDSLMLRDSVIHFSPSDDEISNLYKYAIGFIYPSLYEGFGMPILEAYACGCPVLLNCTSCFQEIAQEAAVFFNSDGNVSNLAERLDYVYKLPAKEKELLVEKQKERLNFFSWEKSSENLCRIYASVIKHV